MHRFGPLETIYFDPLHEISEIAKQPANIPDGTLRILAYTTALYSETSLAAFEEPENCILMNNLLIKIQTHSQNGKQTLINIETIINQNNKRNPIKQRTI